MPPRRGVSGSAAEHVGEAVAPAAWSGLTGIKGPQVATARSRTPSASKPGSRIGSRRRSAAPRRGRTSTRGTALQRLATASPSQTSEPRWRHAEERAELAVVAAQHDEHGDVAGVLRRSSRLRDLVARDVLPAAAEDAFLLGGQHRRVDVPAPREGLRRHRGFHAASVVGHTERYNEPASATRRRSTRSRARSRSAARGRAAPARGG